MANSVRSPLSLSPRQSDGLVPPTEKRPAKKMETVVTEVEEEDEEGNIKTTTTSKKTIIQHTRSNANSAAASPCISPSPSMTSLQFADKLQKAKLATEHTRDDSVCSTASGHGHGQKLRKQTTVQVEEEDDDGVIQTVTTTTVTVQKAKKEDDGVGSGYATPKTCSVQTSPGIPGTARNPLLPNRDCLSPGQGSPRVIQASGHPPLNADFLRAKLVKERDRAENSGSNASLASTKSNCQPLQPQTSTDKSNGAKVQSQGTKTSQETKPPQASASAKAPSKGIDIYLGDNSAPSSVAHSLNSLSDSPRNWNLKKKACIVAGGARGIGKTFCRALLEKGAMVCCADTDTVQGNLCESDFARDFGEDRFFYAECDITKDTQVNDLFDRVISRYGPVRVMINCAAVMMEKEWKKTIEVNVKGAVQLTKYAVKFMGKNNHGSGGVVIYMSGLCGFQGFIASPTYAATMGMMTSMARAWSHPKHYETTHIRFNSISPGVVMTKLWGVYDKDLHIMHESAAKEELEATKKVTLDQCVQALYTILEDTDMNGENIIVSAHEGVFVDEATATYRDLH